MSLNVNNLKVVVFDWDGTLAQTYKPRIEAINKVLEEMNMPKWEKVKSLGDKNISFRDNFHHIFGNHANQAYHKYRNIYLQNLKNEINLYDGVIETLELLRQHDIKLGVMTNKDRKIFDIEMPLLLNKNYFDNIVCGHEAPNDKPSPDHALYTLKGLIEQEDITPQSVWVVGDSLLDNKSAVAINALPIRVNYAVSNDIERLQGAEVYYYDIFKDFYADLAKLLSHSN